MLLRLRDVMVQTATDQERLDQIVRGIGATTQGLNLDVPALRLGWGDDGRVPALPLAWTRRIGDA